MCRHKGILRDNSQGRYAFEDGYYFTSGEPIKILYEGEWIIGRIEYSHYTNDYYFTNENGESIHDLSGIEAKSID